MAQERPTTSLLDTFPGPHLVEKAGGLAFRPGFWFISLDDNHWMVHKAESASWAHASWDSVGTDSESKIEFYIGSCGCFARNGGTPYNFENQRGVAIDSVEEINKVKAQFCLECFSLEQSSS